MDHVFSDREDYSEVEDVYDAKNQGLDLALDCASQFAADQYRSYLDWFIDAKIPVSGPIVDLGCDIGICTCFYASVYPDAEVLGVDNHESSVRIATELAEKLQLRNVRFAKGDFIEPPIAALGGISAGLICSTLAVYENVTGNSEIDGQAYESLADMIRHTLRSGGTLVSVEPNQLESWFEAIGEYFNAVSRETIAFSDAIGRMAHVTAMVASAGSA